MNELEPQDTEFNTISINLDDEVAEELCRIYVEQNMHLASLSLFTDLMSEGADVQHALYRAVINQTVITSMFEDLNKPGHPIPPFDI